VRRYDWPRVNKISEYYDPIPKNCQKLNVTQNHFSNGIFWAFSLPTSSTQFKLIVYVDCDNLAFVNLFLTLFYMGFWSYVITWGIVLIPPIKIHQNDSIVVKRHVLAKIDCFCPLFMHLELNYYHF